MLQACGQGSGKVYQGCALLDDACLLGHNEWGKL
jgi:hypothetical protein